VWATNPRLSRLNPQTNDMVGTVTLATRATIEAEANVA